jgi:hypothetical protein
MFATMSCEDELTDYVADAVVNTMQKVALTQVLSPRKLLVLNLE